MATPLHLMPRHGNRFGGDSTSARREAVLGGVRQVNQADRLRVDHPERETGLRAIMDLIKLECAVRVGIRHDLQPPPAEDVARDLGIHYGCFGRRNLRGDRDADAEDVVDAAQRIRGHSERM